MPGSGGEILKQLLATDESATSLGEVSFVPYTSPISLTKTLFYNTLIDENAASHLAFGNAYRFTLKDGEGMSDEQFQAAGGNHVGYPRRFHGWLRRTGYRRHYEGRCDRTGHAPG